MFWKVDGGVVCFGCVVESGVGFYEVCDVGNVYVDVVVFFCFFYLDGVVEVFGGFVVDGDCGVIVEVFF